MEGPLFSLLLKPEEYLTFGAKKITRTLSQLRLLYDDMESVDRLLSNEDPVVYEVFELPSPYDDSDLLVNITVLYSGQVGQQHFMTKGHFHGDPDTAEAVIGLEGTGELVVQNRRGQRQTMPVAPGRISYAGGGWAHRVINTSEQRLVFLAISGANIVHDYETAARLNFKTEK